MDYMVVAHKLAVAVDWTIALMEVKMVVEQIGTVVVSSVVVEREMFAVESFECCLTG